MKKRIEDLIKQYKQERKDLIKHSANAIENKDWVGVIGNERSESAYDMVIDDLTEILNSKKK